ncbi:hypothetical protein [Alteromonas sp. S015]|uniref:hypothetical protein n=1 Tax=Alteromonas sp. S015 TaxID=3117401 RepID=UPI002FE0BE33
MLNSKISLLSKVLFVSLLFLMQWFTTEEKWWSGALVFFILAFYLAPKSVSKFASQFLNAVNENDKSTAIKAALKMWFTAQGYFLGIASIYYVLIGIIAAIGKMSLHIDGFGVAGVFWLTKVVGLTLANVLLLPVVILFSIYIFNRCISTANNQIHPTPNNGAVD